MVLLFIALWIASGVIPWAMSMRELNGAGWTQRELSGLDLWGFFLAVFYGPLFLLGYLIHRWTD